MKSLATLIPTRTRLPIALNELGLLGVGVEVGVHQGKFSDTILKSWNGMRLYSIDPWIFQPNVKLDKSNVPNEEHEKCYQSCVDLLKPYGSKSFIVRNFSVESAKKFPDGSLDFVYLDARHDYRSVTADLAAWWPKIKVGGIISGHDYFDKFLRKNLVEVKRAVDHFFGYGQLEKIYTTRDDNLTSWFVQKTQSTS